MDKMYKEFLELEKSMGFLTKQLTEKNYENTYVYFNNVTHLLKLYQQLEFYFCNEEFKSFILKKNESSLHGISAAGQLILALLNFLRVAQRENLELRPLKSK